MRYRCALFAAAVAAPLLGFAFLAEEVSDGKPLGLDRSVLTAIGRHSPELRGSIGHAVLELVGLAGLVLVVMLLVALIVRRQARIALFGLTAVGGTLVLDRVLKDAFQRPPLSAGSHGYSFPSGSAMGSMAVLAAVVLVSGTRGRRLILGLVGGCFVIAYGASVVYLRWHYPSDVLAGWSVSLAWVSGIWLAFRGPSLSASGAAAAGVRLGARRLLRRAPVDDALDWIRFRVDTFPRHIGWLRVLRLPELQGSTYQPLPWVGLEGGRRVESTESRWQAMLPLARELGVRSAVDIGANVGWFAFAFAREGIPAIAVEREARPVRVGLYARKRGRIEDASFLVMDVTPRTVGHLPRTDCMLYLSVWHHHVRDFGLPGASEILAELWERTERVLFFETGEGEMPASWGLPEGLYDDSRAWLTEYLGRTCNGAQVRHLGAHEALTPDNSPAPRNLFALVR
jgi:membrane-associated phospholipid phosphatase